MSQLLYSKAIFSPIYLFFPWFPLVPLLFSMLGNGIAHAMYPSCAGAGGAYAPVHANAACGYYLADHMKNVNQNPNPPEPVFNVRFFDAPAFAILSAACARLIPQPEREPFLGIARAIDHRLAEETAGRWPGSTRYLDGPSFRLGIRGLDELSRARLRREFAQLDPVRQEQILFSLQNGTVTGGVWSKLSAKRFFEELLHECTEIYHTAPVTEEAV